MNKAHEIVFALEGLLSNGDPNLDLPSAWARLLGADPSRADFTLAMSAVLSKFDDVQEEIAAAELSERPRALYMGALSTLRPFADPVTLNGRRIAELGKQRQQIDIMHLAVDVLPHVLVPDISTATLESLINSIEELLAGLGESDLDEGLKRLLKVQLSTLLMGLHAYGVLGPSGISRIYGAVAAELMRLAPDAGRASEPTKSLFSKALGIVKTVGAVVVWSGAVVSGAHALLTDGTELLGFDIEASQEADTNSKSKPSP